MTELAVTDPSRKSAPRGLVIIALALAAWLAVAVVAVMALRGFALI